MCHQKLSIIFIIILSTILGCRQTKEVMLKKEANTFFMNQADKITWQLEKSFDPYNGGITSLAPKDNTPYIEYYSNGSFLEHDGTNKNAGNWYVNKDKTALAMIYTTENGKALQHKQSITKEGFQYKIIKLDKEVMVLARQGRHGLVEKTYIKIKN